MGTYYEVRCMDCDETGGVYADRRPDVAQAAVKNAQAIVAFAALVDETDSVPVGVRFGWSGDIEADLEFFTEHAGHRLIAHDGYGTDVGQCFHHIENHYCALPNGHEGAHSPQGPHQRKPR